MCLGKGRARERAGGRAGFGSLGARDRVSMLDKWGMKIGRGRRWSSAFVGEKQCCVRRVLHGTRHNIQWKPLPRLCWPLISVGHHQSNPLQRRSLTQCVAFLLCYCANIPKFRHSTTTSQIIVEYLLLYPACSLCLFDAVIVIDIVKSCMFKVCVGSSLGLNIIVAFFFLPSCMDFNSYRI